MADKNKIACLCNQGYEPTAIETGKKTPLRLGTKNHPWRNADTALVKTGNLPTNRQASRHVRKKTSRDIQKQTSSHDPYRWASRQTWRQNRRQPRRKTSRHLWIEKQTLSKIGDTEDTLTEKRFTAHYVLRYQ
jgi:hypothetical protein